MKRLSHRTPSQFRRLLRDSRGATMVEYALMLFLILVVAAAAVTQLGKTSRSGIDHATGAF
jgi:Flp pilus assembly pilin Flp